MSGELRFDIRLRPDFSLLEVQLYPGQKVFAEPSAMATMSTNVSLKSGLTPVALSIFEGAVHCTDNRFE